MEYDQLKYKLELKINSFQEEISALKTIENNYNEQHDKHEKNDNNNENNSANYTSNSTIISKGETVVNADLPPPEKTIHDSENTSIPNKSNTSKITEIKEIQKKDEAPSRRSSETLGADSGLSVSLGDDEISNLKSSSGKKTKFVKSVLMQQVLKSYQNSLHFIFISFVFLFLILIQPWSLSATHRV